MSHEKQVSQINLLRGSKYEREHIPQLLYFHTSQFSGV